MIQIDSLKDSEKKMKQKKGFTLVELVMTMTIVSILASAFVSLFVPQIMLFLFVPLENKVQSATADAMTTMIEGDRFARGLKYAEPDTIAKQIFIVPQDYDTQRNFTGSILYADPVTVRYGYHDLNRVFHTVELHLNTTNKTLERKIDAGAFTVISNGGSPGTGGLGVFTGDTNEDGLPAVFRYYKKDWNASFTDDLPDPEMTGFANSVIPAANLFEICQVNIAFRANTGGSSVRSAQSEILKSSGARVRTYIYPESNEWDLSFYQQPGEIKARLLAVKKNAANIWVCSLRGEDSFGAGGGGFTVTMPLAGRGDNFTYLMADCVPTAAGTPDGVPDLVEIKKNMTNAARQIQVTIYDGNALANATLLRPTITLTLPATLIDGYEQYDFQMADFNRDANRIPDLFVIQRLAAPTAGSIRIHIYDGGTFALALPAPITKNIDLAVGGLPAIVNNNWKFFITNWNYPLDPNNPVPGVEDSCPDLVAIRQKTGASGTVEVSIFDGTQAGAAATCGTATAFTDILRVDGINLIDVRSARGSINLNNVDFGVGEYEITWDPDAHPEILLIERNPTGGGSAAFHSMSNYNLDGSGIRLLTPTTTIFDQLTNGNDGGIGTGLERDIGSGKSVQ